MADIKRGKEAVGGRELGSNKGTSRSGAQGSSYPQKSSIPMGGMGNECANGGEKYPMDMSTSEYCREKGSDGFSKGTSEKGSLGDPAWHPHPNGNC